MKEAKREAVQLPDGELKRKIVAEVCARIAAGALEELTLERFVERFMGYVEKGPFECPACGRALLFGGVDRREPYLYCVSCQKGVFARGDLWTMRPPEAP